ncbi:MAG: DUF309 domain-containing protein [Sulfurimonas sp.]|jgi:hypothetical protein|nr:DUF309 domain-containing protein [Sulfurimonadaceae bacterium]
MNKALDKFIANLRASNFYEAHEDLEDVWFPRRFEQDSKTKLLRCLINAAVSFELMKKGKDEPSKRVWQNYLKYKEFIDEVDELQIFTKAIIVIEDIHSKNIGENI